MQEKTIKSVLCNKLQKWLSTITDEEVRLAAQQNLVVTGGCFPSLMQNEPPKDYDVYFRDKDTVLKVAHYYVNAFNASHKSVKSYNTTAYVIDGACVEQRNGGPVVTDPELDAGLKSIAGNGTLPRVVKSISPDRVKIYINSRGIAEQLEANDIEDIEMGQDPLAAIEAADDLPAKCLEGDEELPKYRPIFLSSNAITLSDGIQLVIRFYGNPKEIHETYDFTHTKAYYTPDDGVVIPKEVYEAVMNKVLTYTGSKYPLCSVIRLRKFLKRGWTINAGQVLKMCMQISDLDLCNIDVLEDQLVGVDSLYFTMLIEQFRHQQETNREWTLTTCYVMSVIDKIF